MFYSFNSFVDSLDRFQKLKLIEGLKKVSLKYNEFVFHEGNSG